MRRCSTLPHMGHCSQLSPHSHVHVSLSVRAPCACWACVGAVLSGVVHGPFQSVSGPLIPVLGLRGGWAFYLWREN